VGIQTQHAQPCRCFQCEGSDPRTFTSAALFAASVNAPGYQARMDEALAVKRAAVEAERQPASCGNDETCVNPPHFATVLRCFGCPRRRTDTPDWQYKTRAAWT
jgi:hypothetical protein